MLHFDFFSLSRGSMSDGLQKLGEKLKSKREELNLTLKEVENATSIRMLYLQAIEEGRVSHFISNVYALGFIRQYGNFLGLENERLTKEFPDILKLNPEKQDFAYGIGTLEMRGAPSGGTRWVPNLLWGGAFVLLLVGAWYLSKSLGLI
jgi:cytoskeletal protein RodZ